MEDNYFIYLCALSHTHKTELKKEIHTGISPYQMCTRSTFQVKGGIYLKANPINSLAASIGNTLPIYSTIKICVCMLSHSVVSNTLQPHGL